jgi:hypothetical protein
VDGRDPSTMAGLEVARDRPARISMGEVDDSASRRNATHKGNHL